MQHTLPEETWVLSSINKKYISSYKNNNSAKLRKHWAAGGTFHSQWSLFQGCAKSLAVTLHWVDSMLIMTYHAKGVKGHRSIWNPCSISPYWLEGDGRSVLFGFYQGTRALVDKTTKPLLHSHSPITLYRLVFTLRSFTDICWTHLNQRRTESPRFITGSWIVIYGLISNKIDYE